eukprot:6710260-Prymnesium_polylepis.1
MPATDCTIIRGGSTPVPGRGRRGLCSWVRNPWPLSASRVAFLPPRTGDKGYNTHSKCSTS